MSNDQNLSSRASKADSKAAKRDTPRVFIALMGLMVVAAVAIMAVGSRYIFH